MAKAKNRRSQSESRCGERKNTYVYVGQTVRGKAQEGAVFYGTQKEAYEKFKPLFDAKPSAVLLVVCADEVQKIRGFIKQGVGIYANAYRETGE